MQIINFIMSLFGSSAQQAPQPVSAPTPSPVPAVPAVAPLTKEDLLMGRDKQYPQEYTQEVSDNLDKLLIQLNKLQSAYGKPFKINSGWRPSAINSGTAGAATKSNHMKGLAADIADADGKVMEWTLANLDLMKELGIFMEDWRWTPTWTHYQIVPPGSGNRIYIPSKAPASVPNRWAGTYLRKYN